ncbi:MAG: hypothetical protein KBA55_06485 [Ruminococcus sp.]|nr:hypothetical protein [Ruminococcus sp.]
MKKFIRNISPFNNRTDMPAAVLVIKKLLAFILCFVVGTLLGNAVVIGAMIAGGKKFAQGETFSESTMGLLGAVCHGRNDSRKCSLPEVYRKKKALRNGCD